MYFNFFLFYLRLRIYLLLFCFADGNYWFFPGIKVFLALIYLFLVEKIEKFNGVSLKHSNLLENIKKTLIFLEKQWIFTKLMFFNVFSMFLRFLNVLIDFPMFLANFMLSEEPINQNKL
jgi:hypothetical protein